MTDDGLHWDTTAVVEKYDANIDTPLTRLARRLNERGYPRLLIRQERRFRAKHVPTAVDTYRGNIALIEGWTEIWQLVSGAGGAAFGASTLLRVGSNSPAAAAAAANTGLVSSLGSVTVTGAPTLSTVSATWVGSFGAGTATGAWEEWTVENTGGKNLNRKVTSMGTKGAGATWTLTATLTGS